MSLNSEIKHIFEPNPLACGQAVVSMLCDTPVEEVINMVKTEREIDLKTLKNALKSFGLELSERKQAESVNDLPKVAILSLETPRCWHWSLFYNGKVYDPEHGVLDDFPESDRKYYFQVKEIKNG